MSSQIANMQYQRRFKAESSKGIGNLLNHLENLTIGGIIINCYASYFTSKVYTAMFVDQTTELEGADTAPKVQMPRLLIARAHIRLSLVGTSSTFSFLS